MAWRCTGSSNEELVDRLYDGDLIRDQRVRDAMLAVDRAHYAPTWPYEDSPQPIGHHATISAPHMHASACQSLLPFLYPGAKVLDIGSGSGYLTAVFANLVGPEGRVIGVDHIDALVTLSEHNMRKSDAGKRMLDSGNVRFVTADGRKGFEEEAPYDAIHVGAAAAEHHKELEAQLKAPGRMFVPVKEGWGQYIFVVDKDKDGHIHRSKEFGVQYVPLCDHPDTLKRKDSKHQ